MLMGYLETEDSQKFHDVNVLKVPKTAEWLKDEFVLILCGTLVSILTCTLNTNKSFRIF